jgi:hypothetical protein
VTAEECASPNEKRSPNRSTARPVRDQSVSFGPQT